jgi:hypothetical protein
MIAGGPGCGLSAAAAAERHCAPTGSVPYIEGGKAQALPSRYACWQLYGLHPKPGPTPGSESDAWSESDGAGDHESWHDAGGPGPRPPASGRPERPAPGNLTHLKAAAAPGNLTHLNFGRPPLRQPEPGSADSTRDLDFKRPEFKLKSDKLKSESSCQ